MCWHITGAVAIGHESTQESKQMEIELLKVRMIWS